MTNLETVFYTVSKERWHDVAALQRRLKLVDNQIDALMKDSHRSDVGGEVSFKDREKELEYRALDRKKYIIITKIFEYLNSYSVALRFKDYSPIQLKMRLIRSQEDLKNSYVRIKKKDIEKLVAAAEKAYNGVTYEDVELNWQRYDWWRFIRDDEITYDGFYFATTKQFISNMKYLLKTIDFNKEVIVYREGV